MPQGLQKVTLGTGGGGRDFVVFVQLLSCVQPFATQWTTAHQASLSITISRSLLRFMFIELVMLSHHLILCCPPSLPALNLSYHQVFFQCISSLR